MWALPPRRLFLEQGGLHIWRATLDLLPEEQGILEDLLSEEEKGQCGRFVRPADRARAVVSRASLRLVLAQYLGGDARGLAIRAGPSGKPLLDCADPSIQFNISHTGDMALIAVTRGLRVGIDIELIREVPEIDAIIDSFFSAPEAAWFLSREKDERTRAFFLLWTRREAAAKALGIGIYESFARFTLPPADQAGPGFRAEMRDAAEDPAGTWWIRDLLPAPGYAGAVCVEKDNPKPLFWILKRQ